MKRGKKMPSPFTKTQLDYINKRIKNLTGFHERLKSFENISEQSMIDSVLLRNEIKTLNKRIDAINTRLDRLVHKKKIRRVEKE